MYWLLLPPAIISLLSILMLRSIAPDLVVAQSLVALVGLGLALILQKINSVVLSHLAKPLFILSLCLLLITELGGVMSRGSTRWINFGLFRLQPSEIIKFSLIILLSRYKSISKSIPNLTKLITIALYTLLPALIILVQPDLGTALMVSFIGFASFISERFPLKYYLSLLVLLIATIGLLFFTLKDYQRSRITSFMSGHSDTTGSGYNAHQALISIGSGGWIGRGFGNGTQSRLKYLPERQTDFMFSSLVEEGGMMVSLIVVGCYIFMVVFSLSRFVYLQDQFDQHLVFLGLLLLSTQSMTNIAMNLGLLPIVGVTAPFLSYGGSSMLSSWIIVGLIQKSLKEPLYNRVNTVRFV